MPSKKAPDAGNLLCSRSLGTCGTWLYSYCVLVDCVIHHTWVGFMVRIYNCTNNRMFLITATYFLIALKAERIHKSNPSSSGDNGPDFNIGISPHRILHRLDAPPAAGSSDRQLVIQAKLHMDSTSLIIKPEHQAALGRGGNFFIPEPPP